jgi:ketosteroid isomerase-like protein
MNPSEELKNTMLRLYESLSMRDISMIEKLYSHKEDILVIGSDPDEWWVGYEAFARAHKAQFQEMAGDYKIKAGELNAFVEGTVGWVGDRPTIQLPTGQNLPIRVTAVFHQEDGVWKIVQHHVSVGAPNPEVIGIDLPVK